jgi:glycosyltransferase involved in cell wall biosynthesis
MKREKIRELSVFLPAYNEEAHVERTTLDVKSVLLKIANKWEILIINDGSKDNTGKIALDLHEKDKRVKLITHKINRGYGAALKSGFYNAKYEWVAFIDIDGQFDFSEVEKLIDAQAKTHADLVIGYYKDRKVPLYRKLNSFAWQVVVNLLFGLNVRDIDCGFKLINHKVIKKIPELVSERGAFISSEFLIKAKKEGFKIVEVGVTHFPATKKGTGANLNVIIKSFLDLFKLWQKLR